MQNETEILNMYEALLLAVDQLNKDAPEIKTIYSDLEKKIKSAEEKTRKDMEAMSKSFKDNEKAIKELGEGVKKDISSQLDLLSQGADIAEKLIGTVEKSQKAVDILLEKIIDLEAKLSKLDERTAGLKGYLSSSNVFAPIMDYDEEATMGELYNKYSAFLSHPLIVQKTNFSGDFCFAIEDEMPDGFFSGKRFRNGKQYDSGEYIYSASDLCRLYNGPSEEKIISYYSEKQKKT